jgi:DNA repair exonuclease SbcCD nuclease subunit
MTKPIAVISSDTHLKPYWQARMPNMLGDSFYGFVQLVDKCLDLKVPLILAGDVIDRRDPDAETVHFFISCLETLADKDLETYFLQGQHDLSRRQPWLSCAAGTWWVHKKSFQIGPVEFYGLDYTPPGEIHEALDGIPKGTHVLLAHQVWTEQMSTQIGAKVAFDASFSDIPVVGAMFSGDYHTHRVLDAVGKDGQPLKVYSPGSTYLVKTHEDSKKYCYVIYDNFTVESVPLKGRSVVRETITNELGLRNLTAHMRMEEEKFFQELPIELRKPLYLIHYDNSLSDALERLEKAAEGRVHLVATAIATKDAVEEEEALPDRDEGSVSFETQLAVDCQADGELTCADALRLWRSNNPLEEIRSLKEEVLASKGEWSGFGAS